MIVVGVAVVLLGVLVGVCAVLVVRAEHATTREHVTLAARALAAQFVHEREEHRRHIDAAAAVTVAQIAAQLVCEREEHRRHIDTAAAVTVAKLRPVRLVPPVEVRQAPPLVPRTEETTPPAGSRWPGGAA